jgi:hypothetical protein
MHALPCSISGIWKSDLFLGTSDADRWVGTSVKINRTQLEPARGLRLGIVPSREGTSDAVYRDERKNLVVVPLPHDGSFMEIFYQGWGVVQQFLASDARVPKEVALPRAPERQVARLLEDRRAFPIVDVVEALRPLAQPELLRAEERDDQVLVTSDAINETQAILAPLPTVG